MSKETLRFLQRLLSARVEAPHGAGDQDIGEYWRKFWRQELLRRRELWQSGKRGEE